MLSAAVVIGALRAKYYYILEVIYLLTFFSLVKRCKVIIYMQWL